ncbi:MAG: hypothetical protein OXB93_04770 [Cytophagales bacterium]|nr:hypothetical protein [Cytophagales bacterium]
MKIAKDDIEINLSYIKDYLFQRWQYFVLGILLSIIGAVLFLVTAEREYTSAVLVSIEGDASNRTQENILQSLGFFRPSSNSDQVSSYIRDNLLDYYPFLQCLGQGRVQSPSQGETSFLEYFLHDTSIPSQDSISILWNQPLSNGKYMKEIAVREYSALSSIAGSIDVEEEFELHGIRFSVSLPEARPAFDMISQVLFCVSEFFVEYHTIRERANLNYLSQSLESSRLNYQKAQENLANYLDRNINLLSKKAEFRADALRSELRIKEAVYTRLANEHEVSKINLQKKKPILSVLQTSSVPKKPSYPPRASFTIILSLFIGVVASVFFIFGEMTYRLLKTSRDG